ncbi:Spore coat protein U domain-containing protein [Pseudomonas chlororaphis]|uniref:Csu type fimbrial protein n=1 Tax=Pseudomonas chlororaphis TaxID=587753 RepID=UPI0039E60D93
MHSCMRIGLALLGVAMVFSANAETVTGQITLSLTLTSSCQVNGLTGSSGLNFGSLDFGNTSSLFTEADSQLLGGTGPGGGLAILCSSGTSPTVKVGAGLNDGQSSGGTRALSDGNNNFVPYDLYTDPGHNTSLAIDGVISLATSTGMPQTVNIYGKAAGKVGLPAGTYTDTVSVELAF